jgi:hypothetical protein
VYVTRAAPFEGELLLKCHAFNFAKVNCESGELDNGSSGLCTGEHERPGLDWRAIVTRLDRLARSTRDLLNVLDAVAKAKAGFRSLKDTWADTTTPHGRLMLTVLGGLAASQTALHILRSTIETVSIPAAEPRGGDQEEMRLLLSC